MTLFFYFQNLFDIEIHLRLGIFTRDEGRQSPVANINSSTIRHCVNYRSRPISRKVYRYLSSDDAIFFFYETVNTKRSYFSILSYSPTNSANWLRFCSDIYSPWFLFVLTDSFVVGFLGGSGDLFINSFIFLRVPSFLYINFVIWFLRNDLFIFVGN